MATRTEQLVPTLVHGLQPASTTAQTRAMVRRPGIAGDTSGAQKIWMGHVTGVPNEAGPPHHHGEAETAAYILTGRMRVYFGESFDEYIEAGPGDFLFVPAQVPHIEANPYDDPVEAIVSRSPDNIVVNLGK